MNDPRWARALHESAHAIVALCQRQAVSLITISDPDRSYCSRGARYDPRQESARERVLRDCAFWYAGSHICELTFGTSNGSGSNSDFADVQRALDTLPESKCREVARKAWLLSKRLVLYNEGAIHLLARRLYETGRMDFRQICDALQPVRRAGPAWRGRAAA
jgi:hypothetical protein